MAPTAVPTSAARVEPQRRSRLFARLRQQVPKVKCPEVPLILAGALGGPFVIFFLTPLRNALTLASQEPQSASWELYVKTFQDGFCGGWTGGFVPVIPSCPQFVMMGPLFHVLKEATHSAFLAVVLSSMAETIISFGSQTLNAQLAYNAEQAAFGGEHVPLFNPWYILGPGVTPHVLRNIVNACGIRVFAGPCHKVMEALAERCGLARQSKVMSFLADFIAAICAACLSAPLNQCYNFAVTSEDYINSNTAERTSMLLGFVSDSYLLRGETGQIVGFTPTLGRDLFMRCAYVATLMTMFSAIEKIAVALGKRRKPTPA
mmetsp:Transcript_30410/g.70934  ORF Transcript_30410/g.70934 Transcript_30410/m.70934 type:complete len:318 (+) Transcript_30410:107-1060(+)|eukprot:CAMPEP_0178418528 /NCGR_PEP_ID=MMETSP0689_2-20121128/25134_1 /TAXON_ID=160604 /ORGANISM="Amphidinium massartii, Strain CS-259" /LENGTH=317 /DNA_ID=CAMNT_0020039923 /DNA_START=77 /DNA_END=1030 /DNA_ORIENTATION=-